jgi:hypothetical protein
VFDGFIQRQVKSILGRNGIIGFQHYIYGRRPITAKTYPTLESVETAKDRLTATPSNVKALYKR